MSKNAHALGVSELRYRRNGEWMEIVIHLAAVNLPYPGASYG